MRPLTVDLDSVLELVSCADDYGFNRDILVSAFAEWTGPVSDAEIAEYAAWFLTPEAEEQGYGQEDADEAQERLTEWRDKYANGARP